MAQHRGHRIYCYVIPTDEDCTSPDHHRIVADTNPSAGSYTDTGERLVEENRVDGGLHHCEEENNDHYLDLDSDCGEASNDRVQAAEGHHEKNRHAAAEVRKEGAKDRSAREEENSDRLLGAALLPWQHVEQHAFSHFWLIENSGQVDDHHPGACKMM